MPIGSMRRIRQRSTPVGAVLVAAALLTSCSSGPDDASLTTPGTTWETPPPTATISLETSIPETAGVDASLPEEVVFYSDSGFMSRSIQDVVSYADFVGVFTVTGERDLEPEGSVEQYIPRSVTVELVQEMWVSHRIEGASEGDIGPASAYIASGADNPQLEFLTLGSVIGGDPRRERVAVSEHAPRLEVGSTYVGALFFDQFGQHGVWPESLLEIDDVGRVVAGESPTLTGKSVGEIAALVEAAQPWPEVMEAARQVEGFWEITPEERSAVAYEYAIPVDGQPRLTPDSIVTLPDGSYADTVPPSSP